MTKGAIIDNTIDSIWTTRFNRYSNKLDLLSDELSQINKTKVDFLEKSFQILGYNCSRESYEKLNKFFDDIIKIKIPTSNGIFTSIGFGYNSNELEEYRTKLYKVAAQTLRDITLSYYEFNDCKPDIDFIFVKRAATIKSLFEKFGYIAEQAVGNDKEDIIAKVEDGIRAVSRIYINLIYFANNKESVDELEKFIIDYIALSNNDQRKIVFLDYIYKKREEKDSISVLRILEQFFNGNQNWDIVIKAFEVYSEIVNLPENKKNINIEVLRQKEIMEAIKKFLNIAESEENGAQRNKRNNTIVNFFERSFDLFSLFDFSSIMVQIMGNSKIAPEIITKAFIVFEKGFEKKRDSEFETNKTYLKERLQKIFLFVKSENYFMVNDLTKIYANLFGQSDLANFLFLSKEISPELRKNVENALLNNSFKDEFPIKFMISNYKEISVSTLKVKTLNAFGSILEYGKIHIDSAKVKQFIRELGVEKINFIGDEQYKNEVLATVFEVFDKYKIFDEKDYYEVLEYLFRRN